MLEQRIFDEFNAKYFGGRLPEFRILRSDRFGRGCQGLCRRKEREIHLGARLHGSRLREVLLHEMAHAATNGSHAKAWQAEMLRLAEMGAPTRKELEAYQDPNQTLPFAAIKGEAYDAGVETDVAWSTVRPAIGRSYGLTDSHGRSESTGAAKRMQQLRKEFYKGRRLRGQIRKRKE